MPRNRRNAAEKVTKELDYNQFRDLKVILKSTKNCNNAKGKINHGINCYCSFDYVGEKFTLGFQTNVVTLKPVSIKVMFRKQTISSFKYDTNGVSYRPGMIFSEMVSFTKNNIDFFGFSKDRIFSIAFTFQVFSRALGSSIALCESIFEFALPVIKQVELRFKPPGTSFPDESTRRICQQQFKMNPKNSEKEIKQCILLEEFRLLSKVDRYQIYGYVKMLNLFLDIENSFELDLVQKFNLNNVNLQQVSFIHYKIDTPGHIPNAAASVRLTPMDILNNQMDKSEVKKHQINGPIINYQFRSVTFEIKRNGKRKMNEKDRFQVEFCPNFYSNAMAQRALTRIDKVGYVKFMESFDKSSLPIKGNFQFPSFENIEWLNQDVGGNFAQSQAIKHIVNRSSFPAPYIVFGPPGTGKTSTLVEAVAQIVKLQPLAKVLITVNSNSACDEIGERLMKFVGVNKMYRFYSPSFSKKMERVNQKLKICSNLRYNYHIQPSVQELVSYNVIICTLVNSGRMKSIGTHFDFIFIDECASSAEPYVVIPMSLAMKKGEKFKASVVLLGDPKQLGQIMRTHHSERYGFNVSLMERVMDLDSYDFGDFGYDPKFIVQLTDNFRSHRSILEFSNKQFYNSILKAKQQQSIANFAIGWELLPNPQVPVMFVASYTRSEVEGTSQVNQGDIWMVKKYVGSLLSKGINGQKVAAKHIGIISPYAAQRELLKKVYPTGIEIGTVEYFQGREKLIIIVSSVRSKTPTIGFLKNEKRLNVALTRAKALLIVIGNPETLSKNHFWRNFIVNCGKNKAIVGKIPGWIWRKDSKDPKSEEDEDDVIRLEEMMNEMNMED